MFVAVAELVRVDVVAERNRIADIGLRRLRIGKHVWKNRRQPVGMRVVQILRDLSKAVAGFDQELADRGRHALVRVERVLRKGRVERGHPGSDIHVRCNDGQRRGEWNGFVLRQRRSRSGVGRHRPPRIGIARVNYVAIRATSGGALQAAA